MNGEKRTILSVRNLSVDFSVKGGSIFAKKNFVSAVRDVSLDVYAGESFGLVGESGCGKSTLANATIGLQNPTAGEIFFDGKPFLRSDKKTFAEQRKRMQKIFQDPGASLNPRFSVLDIVAEPLVIRGGFTPEERREKVVSMLESVGLGEEDLERSPSDFSGGQQQRVAIARTLNSGAPFILADEPTGNLDEDTAAEISGILKESAHELDKCVIVVTHSGELAKQADVVFKLRKGALQTVEKPHGVNQKGTRHT